MASLQDRARRLDGLPRMRCIHRMRLQEVMTPLLTKYERLFLEADTS